MNSLYGINSLWGVRLKYKLRSFSRVVKIDPAPVNEKHFVPAYIPREPYKGSLPLPFTSVFVKLACILNI